MKTSGKSSDLELVSFVACFGFAMGLLSLHRFPAAIICFSIGCASLSLVVLTVVFSYTNAWWKIASILGTMIATFICMGYLMGLVVQAENEYYEPLIAHEVEMAKNRVHPPHPTPIKKEVIIAPSEQHATQDEVNHPGAIERKSTVLGLCYLPADNSACSIACTVENNGPIVSKNITMGFVGPLPIRIQIASDPEFRVELKKSDTLPIPNQNGQVSRQVRAFTVEIPMLPVKTPVKFTIWTDDDNNRQACRQLVGIEKKKISVLSDLFNRALDAHITTPQKVPDTNLVFQYFTKHDCLFQPDFILSEEGRYPVEFIKRTESKSVKLAEDIYKSKSEFPDIFENRGRCAAPVFTYEQTGGSAKVMPLFPASPFPIYLNERFKVPHEIHKGLTVPMDVSPPEKYDCQ